jgi:hypothetical protein
MTNRSGLQLPDRLDLAAQDPQGDGAAAPSAVARYDVTDTSFAAMVHLLVSYLAVK